MVLHQYIIFIERLCRADTSLIRQWIDASTRSTLVTIIPLLLASTAIYGATLGLWHGFEMSLYVALKFPLAILATLSINAFINGIFATLSGSQISIAQSFKFLLIGFTIFGIIIASLCPILFFFNLNNAAPGEEGMAQAYRLFITSNILLISFSGLISHYLLLRHVRHFASSPKAGSLTFISWLAMNFFVGAEVMHKLRPFFGAPKLKVEFIREEMLQRNFYESFYHILEYIT